MSPSADVQREISVDTTDGHFRQRVKMDAQFDRVRFEGSIFMLFVFFSSTSTLFCQKVQLNFHELAVVTFGNCLFTIEVDVKQSLYFYLDLIHLRSY